MNHLMCYIVMSVENFKYGSGFVISFTLYDECIE